MQTQGLLCVEMRGPPPPPLPPLSPLLLTLLPLSKGTVICPGSDLAHVSMHGMRPEVSQSGSWQMSLCPSGKDVWWIRAVPWGLAAAGMAGASPEGTCLHCLDPLS